MTVMERPTNEVDALRARSCTGKKPLGFEAAHAIAKMSRGPEQDPQIGALEAYRCPFAAEHPGEGTPWHVGHPMSMYRLVQMARVLRARSGNAPGPVNPSAGARIGRIARKRKGKR